MKKTVTILSAFLILLSGVHFTVATHYCNERLAGTKISLSGKTASCGMESPEKPGTPKPGAPGSNQINSHCCDDHLSTVGVSGIFVQPATLTTNDFQVSFHDLFFPVLPLTLLNNNYAFYPDTGPPGINLKVSSVRLDHICEFRI
jgi:hypothetical protein